MQNTQQGRSMIEMLGVLAIIGVLSIGGLAGYTMAMNRHRANQILDYVSRAVVIAQTKGDGSQAISNEDCSTILDGEAVPVANMTCKVNRSQGIDENTTVAVGSINSRIAAALENRSGNQVTITSTSNSASFTFMN